MVYRSYRFPTAVMLKPTLTNRSRPIALGALVLAFLLGFASEASARCGSSPRHMLWRNATNAELIQMDQAELNPTVGPKLPKVLEPDLGMAHVDGDRPCSSCRCKNEKEPGIPLEAAPNDSTNSPICRFPGSFIASRPPFLGGQIASVSDTFLCPTLGLLERPPRALCA
jgi:hypothetical protein